MALSKGKKILIAVVAGVVVKIIDFVPNALEQSESTMKGLFYIPQIVIIIMSVCAVIPLVFYGISRKKQIEIIGELQERKKLLQSLTDGGGTGKRRGIRLC